MASNVTNNKENLDFMSDFLLRIAMISGNADLDIHSGYLVSVKNKKGYYISYYTNDFQIHNALHNASRNIFHIYLSTQKLKSENKQDIDSSSIHSYTNDSYPFEAIKSLPRELLATMQEPYVKTEPDKDKEELAQKLSKGYNSKQIDTPWEKKIRKLKDLVSNIAEQSKSVSVDIINGIYYIITPAKDGTFLVCSTTDWKLESEDSHFLKVRRISKRLAVETLRSGLHDQSFDLDSEELIQHDATSDELKPLLPDYIRRFGHSEPDVDER